MLTLEPQMGKKYIISLLLGSELFLFFSLISKFVFLIL
jgi:hypothetical protein